MKSLKRSLPTILILLLLLSADAAMAFQQQGVRLTGRVTRADGSPAANALVLIVDVGLSTRTDHEGAYEIAGIPAGTHVLVAQQGALTSERQTVELAAGGAATLDFTLALTGVREEITVTASATGETTAFDTFNAVTSLDSLDLAENMSGTLGEVLENQPGVAKRGFGPGNSRPIIRGFDGDRVLVMQDGIRTGDLSSQSGDHGVSIDPGGLERLEVVKGPATLLYGSNAVGGVVNAITPHEAHLTDPHQGLQSQVTIDGGTANAQGGGNGSFQYAEGNWLFWVGGGGRRTGNYDTPIGTIENSATDLRHGRLGFALYGDRAFFAAGYQMEDSTYGVPFAGEFHGHHEGEEEEEEEEEGHEEEVFVDLESRRQSVRLDFGLHGLEGRFLDGARFIVNYLDYHHDEIEIEDGARALGTAFDNETYAWRAEIEQKKVGRLHGKFGADGQFRDYAAAGEEALSPPTTQRSAAVFAYEELDFEGFRLQFGGRVEHNGYEPGLRPELEEHDEEEEEEGHEEPEPPDVRDRSFTGLSGSAGVQVDLSDTSSFVANLTRSYRAPSLEELYNFGPHVGNVTFEIGNPDLERESTIGLDLSLRHRSERARAQFNVFLYEIRDFVFPASTGDFEGALQIAEFLQGDGRFVGFDAKGDFRLHPMVWLKLGASVVSARLTDTDEPLPRIPPLHGTVELELYPYQGLKIEPQLVLAARQDDVFRSEEPTAGYAVANLSASYSLFHGQLAHVFSLRFYNAGDRLYRNHTSFIKELAPEMGRGVKASYALRFY